MPGPPIGQYLIADKCRQRTHVGRAVARLPARGRVTRRMTIAGGVLAAGVALTVVLRRHQWRDAPLHADASRLPRAGVVDTVRILLGVVAPTVAKGVIVRRPRVVALAAFL